MPRTVTWYLTGSQNPYADAVEPAAAGIDIPDEILDWAAANGLSMDEPDVYLLVASEQPGEIIGMMASRDGEIGDRDAGRLDEALRSMDDERAERRGLLPVRTRSMRTLCVQSSPDQRAGLA